jgi:hypothetical protein
LVVLDVGSAERFMRRAGHGKAVAVWVIPSQPPSRLPLLRLERRCRHGQPCGATEITVAEAGMAHSGPHISNQGGGLW